MTDENEDLAHRIHLAEDAACSSDRVTPETRALAALASVARWHLTALENRRRGRLSEVEAQHIESELRRVVFSPPRSRPTVVALEPVRGPRWWAVLVRAYRRMRHGWRP